MSYIVTHYDDIQKVPLAVDSFLNEKPATNFEAIGILENLRNDPETYDGTLECVTISNRNGILTVICRIIPFNLLISHSKNIDSVHSLVKYYLKIKTELPGIYGPLSEVHSFIKAWEEWVDEKFKTSDEFFQYSLNRLKALPEYVGDISIASQDHEPLLSKWTEASIREILPNATEKFEKGCINSLKKLIEKKRVFILDVDGTIVSMAAISERTKTMQAINDVYTPPEFRGMGHATELCTFLTSYILNDCRNIPVLWVKTTNLTAIHIYEKIGFEQVAKMALCLK